ncbi:MAG: cell wall hydrolase, partial [Methylococcales bacterium]
PGDADWSLSADRFGSGARGAMQGFRIREDLDCLALNIYFEARSESTLGRRAVGHVVMNRVNHRDFPHSICEVVRQGGSRVLNRCQFSWWCDGQSDIPYNRVQWILALKLAYNIYTGASKDPTGGALWYHADYSNPTWGRAFRRGPKIGRHIFYRESHAKSRFL